MFGYFCFLVTQEIMGQNAVGLLLLFIPHNTFAQNRSGQVYELASPISLNCKEVSGFEGISKTGCAVVTSRTPIYTFGFVVQDKNCMICRAGGTQADPTVHEFIANGPLHVDGKVVQIHELMPSRMCPIHSKPLNKIYISFVMVHLSNFKIFYRKEIFNCIFQCVGLYNDSIQGCDAKYSDILIPVNSFLMIILQFLKACLVFAYRMPWTGAGRRIRVLRRHGRHWENNVAWS